jgi:hypothetical protein
VEIASAPQAAASAREVEAEAEAEAPEVEAAVATTARIMIPILQTVAPVVILAQILRVCSRHFLHRERAGKYNF